MYRKASGACGVYFLVKEICGTTKQVNYYTILVYNVFGKCVMCVIPKCQVSRKDLSYIILGKAFIFLCGEGSDRRRYGRQKNFAALSFDISDGVGIKTL